MVCKNCGKEILDDAIFCKHCGFRVDGKISCPNCNFLNDETDTFCAQCGTRIDGKKFCKNCGSEVDGVFCSKCGQKYVEINSKKIAFKETGVVQNSTVSKILDVVGNSVLMLGVVFSLIFIFFIGFSETIGGVEVASSSNSIFYYFGKAYDNLKSLFSMLSNYSASFKTSYYLTTILQTVVVASCLIGCIIFTILATVRFVKKMCNKSTKSPALFSLLSIVFYFVCVTSLKNIIYYEYLEGIETIVLNTITKTGIILSIVCALSYYALKIVNDALTLNKSKIVPFIFSHATSLILIVITVLLCNNYVLLKDQNNVLQAKTSFMWVCNRITTITSQHEMIAGVIFSVITQMCIIASLFIVVYVLAKSISSKNEVKSFICPVVMLLATMVFSIVAVNLYSNFIVELLKVGKTNEMVGFAISPSIIVAFILSIIALVLNIIKTIFKNKGTI
ncbi:MAG: zinc ribbon domain-containing protein [Clostridiales bacterium]|nr:zinc ribbon domain-containing protein [Clostridiales bacterium]